MSGVQAGTDLSEWRFKGCKAKERGNSQQQSGQGLGKRVYIMRVR